MNTTVIRTVQGRTIMLQHDAPPPRPKASSAAFMVRWGPPCLTRRRPRRRSLGPEGGEPASRR